MDKIWYILIDSVEEGPFSAKELFGDKRVSLDTLVWKEGLEKWIPLRNVSELRKLFEKRESSFKEEETKEEEQEHETYPSQGELVLDYRKGPNFFLIWLMIALILILYLLYEIYAMP
jgi:GYF domain 2